MAEPSVLHHQNLLSSVRLHGCLPGLNQANDSTFTGESPTAHTSHCCCPQLDPLSSTPKMPHPEPTSSHSVYPSPHTPTPLTLECTVLLCCSGKTHSFLKDRGYHLLGGSPSVTHPPPPSFSSKARSPPLRSHHLGQEPKKIQISAWLAECLGKAVNYFSSHVRKDLEDGGEDNHAVRAEDGMPAPTAHHEAPLHCTLVVSLGFPTTGTCARRFCHSPLMRQVPQAGTHRTQSFLKEAVIGVRCTWGHFLLLR